MSLSFDALISNVIQWATERSLDKSDPKTQLVKLMEELGELSSDVIKQRDVKDSIGDCLVVLTVLSLTLGVNLTECYELAYKEIKDRKGKLINNSFVKQADLNEQTIRDSFPFGNCS